MSSSFSSLSARNVFALSQPSAAAAAAVAEGSGLWISNPSPATASQLHSLTSIPSGMIAAMQAKRGGKKKGSKMAKDGQIVSVFYDVLGKRPYPTNGLSLEQGITLELEYVVPNWLTSATIVGAQTYAAQIFTVASFSAASTLLSVFDQYRFLQVEVWIQCTAPNGITPFPFLATVVDLDDGNVPTAIGQIQDRQGAAIGGGPGGHYHKWLPHVAVATFSGAFTSYANTPACWIDSASPNVQHYGIKAATLAQGTSAYSYEMTIRAVVSFRAPAIN